MGECSKAQCERIAEMLLQFRDGTLPDDEVQFVRDHLHRCPPCVGIFNSYEEVLDVLKRLKPDPMPPGLIERMRAKVAEGADLQDDMDGAEDCTEPDA